MLSVITFVCGILGAYTGAWIIDSRIQKVIQKKAEENVPEALLEKHRNYESNRILGIALTFGAIAGVIGVAIGSFIPFIICFCVSEFFQLM